MKTNRGVFALFLLTILVIYPFVPTSFANDIRATIQIENDYYKNLVEKNKSAIVTVRVEVDPSKIKKTDTKNNDPTKNNNPPFIPPVYREMFIYEDTGVVQAFTMGTGFIITTDGEILTNHHIIENFKEIYLTLYDNSVFKADIIGFDVPTDLALLKIKTEKPNFPTLTLGDSSLIYAPEKIMIIGHPFGLNYTVSLGTISGLNRSTFNPHPFPLIQVQSSINPGNSGSPLISVSENKVLGIIFSIIPDADQIGFAIPINNIAEMLPFLRNPPNKNPVKDQK